MFYSTSLEFVDLLNFRLKSFGVALVYSCLLEHSPLFNKMIIYLSKKIILEAIMHFMVCVMLNGYNEDLAWGLFS